MIEFVDVSADLQGQRILTDLDFQVEAGETLVLLGRSGSGKSTTLRLVNRLIDPVAGEIRVEGKPTTGWDPRLNREVDVEGRDYRHVAGDWVERTLAANR